MKKIILTISALSIALLISCGDDDSPMTELPPARDFEMGFTTWPFGPNQQDVEDTYAFIGEHADIYAEHIDNLIPWDDWINDTALPSEFTNDIIGKANKKIAGKKLLLAVSILNSNRDEIVADFDGEIPTYTSFSDTHIEDAYFKHISYLLDQFDPDYLVIAIEVNELRLRSPEKWEGYQTMITNVKQRVKQENPGLPIAESVSLHNLYEPEINDSETYINDIINHINQMDFAAISYYPFLKNQSTSEEFQTTLDFLHNRVTPPIAFVETAHIAENLIIPNLNVSIDGSTQEQNTYLETLLSNAETNEYQFIIWWAHRDYDALWETFPEDIKDLGQIWRDTGLLNEDGVERPAFETWKLSLENVQ